MAHTSLHRASAEHLASVGEGYLEHLTHAAGFGARLLTSGLACLVHAVLPMAFTHVGSDAVQRLHREMVIERRHRAPR
jgi:hypothetical protein